MNNKFSKGLFLILMVILPYKAIIAKTEDIIIHTETPRNFGYTFGDTLTLTITIDTPLFYSLETGYLPQPGAVKHWLQLKQIKLNEDAGGHDYKLTLIFQIFPETRTTDTLSIPALPLRFQYAGEIIETEIPAWTFTYSPLLAGANNTGSNPIQPLMGTLPIKQAHSKTLVYLFTGLAIALSYLLWFYGKLPFLEHYSGPFGKACKTIKQLLKHPKSENAYQHALMSFHHALDETAGETVLANQLPAFFQNYPHFKSLQQETEQLMQHSQQFFFNPKINKLKNWPLEDISLLCHQYRKIERSGRWL